MMMMMMMIMSFKSVLLMATLLIYAVWVVTIMICISNSNLGNDDDEDVAAVASAATTRSITALPYPLDVFAWSFGQSVVLFMPHLSKLLTDTAWASFEQRSRRRRRQKEQRQKLNVDSYAYHGGGKSPSILQEIQRIDVQEHNDASSALSYLSSRYGPQWRERPLLLQNLWTRAELSSPARRLSLNGMTTTMNWTIPYYTDATIHGALRPDGDGLSVNEIVSKIKEGRPYKIGSQFVVQHDPTLMDEVAPREYITKLFGNYFTTDQLLGHGKTLGIFPGLTTVPVFVANTAINVDNLRKSSVCENAHATGAYAATSTNSNNDDNTHNDDQTCLVSTKKKQEDIRKYTDSDHPVTGLHCEPIANIAVQLSGYRQWTLVDPKYSWMLRPSISADGRSFYPSWISRDQLQNVPRFEVMTSPGDALFVPTWTWHRVDYTKATTASNRTRSGSRIEEGRHEEQLQQDDTEDASEGDGESDNVSIGASLFHFRIGDYVRRNPLFAILLVPAIIREAMGISTQ